MISDAKEQGSPILNFVSAKKKAEEKSHSKKIVNDIKINLQSNRLSYSINRPSVSGHMFNFVGVQGGFMRIFITQFSNSLVVIFHRTSGFEVL